VSIPLGAGAGEREAVGLADVTATALELAIVVTLLPLALRLRLPALTERALSPRAAGAALVAVAFAAFPLTAAASLAGVARHAGHHDDEEVAAGDHHHADDEPAHPRHEPAHQNDEHPAEEHEVLAGASHGHEEAAALLQHAHTPVAAALHATGAAHGHPATASGGTTHAPHAPGAPAEPPHDGHVVGPPPPGEPPHVGHPPLPTGPIISIADPRLTPAQREAAMLLLGRTQAALGAFPTVASVEAAGYESIGDEVTGYVHYVNWSYLADGHEFDPARMESIVAQVNPGGSRSIVSGLYIMEVGKTMADVPDIAGELTALGFHDHQNLCFVGHRLAGLAVNGVCPAGSVLLPTPPMIHVWLTDRPCGPFSTIDGHGTDCGSHAH
jgi:hypothetical protein